MPDFTVLLNMNGDGLSWERHPKSVPAANGDAAIAKLRDERPELKANRQVQFLALGAAYRPRRYRRALVERFVIADASEPDDELDPQRPAGEQGTLA